MLLCCLLKYQCIGFVSQSCFPYMHQTFWVDHHFLRDQAVQGTLLVEHVSTTDKIADYLTTKSFANFFFSIS